MKMSLVGVYSRPAPPVIASVSPLSGRDMMPVVGLIVPIETTPLASLVGSLQLADPAGPVPDGQVTASAAGVTSSDGVWEPKNGLRPSITALLNATSRASSVPHLWSLV